MIDLHSHILPALDDGADSLDASREMFRAAAESGVDTIVATTHFSRQAEADYDRVFAETEAVAKECGIVLLKGMEYDYDRLSEIPPEKLRGLGGGRMILIDLKESYIGSGVNALLFNLGLKGKTILLAHPERLWGERYALNLAALQEGALTLQINAGSLLGCYGPVARRTAWKLLETFPRCVVAGDAHRPSGFRFAACKEALEKAFPAGNARLWLEENPRRILAGLPALPADKDDFLFRRFRRFRLTNW
ncbi:MAG: hypothetical protein MJ016_01260 [Victivallaceae bacterium]|nr:hypothetical protein [Victivallaceae bacterium]